MHGSRLAGFLAATVLAAFAAAPAFAKTLTVTDFRDDPQSPVVGSLRYVLTSPAAGLAPGDTIVFAPGLGSIQLAGPVNVDMANLTIQGPVRFAEQPGGFTGFLHVIADGVTIRGITFDLGTYVDVEAGVSDTKILGNHFIGGQGVTSRQSFGLVVGTLAEPNTFEKTGVLSEIDTDVSVVGNTFKNAPIGIRVVGDGRNAVIESNRLDAATIEVDVRSGRVASNTITTSFSKAISVLPTSIAGYGGLTISGNTIDLSGRASGIDVTGRGRLTITGNTIRGAKTRGLGIGWGCGGDTNEVEGTIDVAGNTVTGCFTGITFICQGPQAPVVTIHDNADVSHNAISGLLLNMGAAGRATVTANHFTDNGSGAKGAGIQVATGGAPIDFSGNQAARNAVGVDVGAGAGTITFQGDTVEANRSDGFRFAAATASVSGVTCKANGGAGVLVGTGGAVKVSQSVFGGNKGAGIDLAPKGVTANATPKTGNAGRNWPEPFAFDPPTQSFTGTTTPSAVVEFFRVADGARTGNPANGEGTEYIGSVTAGADGKFSFPVTGKVGDVYTCTSTTPGANAVTSEFAPDAYYVPKPPPPAQTTGGGSPPAYAVTGGGKLLKFDPDHPGTATGTKSLTGLAPGETLVGIDLLQGIYELMGLGSTGRIYTIDPANGACTPYLPMPLTIDLPSSGVELEGTAGSAFELHLVRGTGVVTQIILPLSRATDYSNPLKYVGGAPVSANGLFDEYYNGELLQGLPQPAVFTRFGIDATNDVLFRITNVFGGNAETVGPLGIDVTSVLGADADYFTRRALFAATTMSFAMPHLFDVNVATGAATDLGELVSGGPSDPVIGFCIGAPPPIRVNYLMEDGTAWGTTLVPGFNEAPTMPLASFHPTVPLLGAGYAGPTDVFAVDANAVVRRYDIATGMETSSFSAPDLAGARSATLAPGTGLLDWATAGGGIVRLDTSSEQATPNAGLAYAPGDPNVLRTPSFLGLANFGAFGGPTPDSVYIVDVKDSSTQFFSMYGGPSQGLTTIGQMYSYTPTGRAALAMLPGGVPLFESENDVSHFANFCLVRPETGITVLYAWFPVPPGGPRIVGMHAPLAAAGASSPAPVSAGARLSLTGRDYFTLVVKPNTPPAANARKSASPYAGVPIVVDAGGLTRLLVPAANGRAKSGDASLTLTTKPDGSIDVVSFTVSGEFSDVLAAAGLDLSDDARDEAHTVPVTLAVGDEFVVAFELSLVFDATAGRKGTATLAK